MVRLTCCRRFDFSYFLLSCVLCIHAHTNIYTYILCIECETHSLSPMVGSKIPKKNIHTPKNTFINKYDVWITRLFSLIDVGLSRRLFFGISHTLLHGRPNCNTLQIGIHVFSRLSVLLHTCITSMYVCTLSAHLTQSTFLCVALVVAVAVVGHQALLLLLLWFILCLISSALCYRCVWVIMYMHICVCNHFFVHISWLPCLSLKKPISFRMCISFIWKRWIKKTPNHIQKKSTCALVYAVL